LGAYGIAVLNVLCRYADKDKGYFPSQDIIAEAIGCNRDVVNNAIKKLGELGIIK